MFELEALDSKFSRQMYVRVALPGYSYIVRGQYENINQEQYGNVATRTVLVALNTGAPDASAAVTCDTPD
eukprot:scaffold105666_cov50-Prasinocladus_malaysianus.AAC.2